MVTLKLYAFLKSDRITIKGYIWEILLDRMIVWCEHSHWFLRLIVNAVCSEIELSKFTNKLTILILWGAATQNVMHVTLVNMIEVT